MRRAANSLFETTDIFFKPLYKGLSHLFQLYDYFQIQRLCLNLSSIVQCSTESFMLVGKQKDYSNSNNLHIMPIRCGSPPIHCKCYKIKICLVRLRNITTIFTWNCGHFFSNQSKRALHICFNYVIFLHGKILFKFKEASPSVLLNLLGLQASRKNTLIHMIGTLNEFVVILPPFPTNMTKLKYGQ